MTTTHPAETAMPIDRILWRVAAVALLVSLVGIGWPRGEMTCAQSTERADALMGCLATASGYDVAQACRAADRDLWCRLA